MAGNSLITPDIIARGMLAVMHNATPLIAKVERQYDNSFGEGAQVNGNLPGPSIRIRKPVRSTVSDGAALDIQDTVEDTIVLTQSVRKQISRIFTAQDLTLTVAEFGPRYIEPAAKALASAVEQQLTGLYKDVYNNMGSDVLDISKTTLLKGQALLSNYAVPHAQRFGALTPEHMSTLADSMTTLFNPQTIIAEQFKTGLIGASTLGADWYEDQNLYSHTVGTRTISDATVAGASQSGSTLSIGATSPATAVFNRGDTFKIDGIFLVNYETKAKTTTLQPFVVTADATAVGTNVTLSISPSIITSGPTQTVYSATGNMPANSAVVRFDGTASTTHPQSMLMHKSAFALASAPLYMPEGVDWKARADGDGLSIRVIRQYVINTDALPVRMDILLGVKTLYEFAACRLWS